MKTTLGCLALALLLSACAANSQMKAMYEKYDAHCREHAKEITAEVDEEIRYRECMDYYTGKDFDCPYCITDQHMEK